MKWNKGFPPIPGHYAVVLTNPHLPHLGRWKDVVMYEDQHWYNVFHAEVLYWTTLPEIPTEKYEIALAIVDNGGKL